jgi:hypothetical protein
MCPLVKGQVSGATVALVVTSPQLCHVSRTAYRRFQLWIALHGVKESIWASQITYYSQNNNDVPPLLAQPLLTHLPPLWFLLCCLAQ